MLKVLSLLLLMLILSCLPIIERLENNSFLVSLEYNSENKIYDLYGGSSSFLTYNDFRKTLKEIFKNEFKIGLTKSDFENKLKNYVKITNDDFNYKNVLCQDNIINNYDIKYQLDKSDNRLFIQGFTDIIYKIYLEGDSTGDDSIDSDKGDNLFIKNLSNMFNKNICYDEKRNSVVKDVIDSPIKKKDIDNERILKLTPNILEIIIENDEMKLYELIKDTDNTLIRNSDNVYKIPDYLKLRINISNENYKLDINNTYSLDQFKNSIIDGKTNFNKLIRNDELDCNSLEYKMDKDINCNVSNKDDCDVNRCNWLNNKCSDKDPILFNENNNFIDKFLKEKNCKDLNQEECTMNCQWYSGKCMPHTYNKKPMFSCSNDGRIIIELNKNNTSNISYIFYDLCPASIESNNIGQMNYFNDNCSSYPVMTNVISSYNNCNKYNTQTDCATHDCNWAIPPTSINKDNKDGKDGKDSKQCIPFNLESYPFNYWLTSNNVGNLKGV